MLALIFFKPLIAPESWYETSAKLEELLLKNK